MRSSNINENISHCCNIQNSHENQQHQPDIYGVHQSLQPELVPTRQHPLLLDQHQNPGFQLQKGDQHNPVLSPNVANEHPLLLSQEQVLLQANEAVHHLGHAPALHHVGKPSLHHHLAIGLPDQQAAVHVPNIPVQNQFSCLANIP